MRRMAMNGDGQVRRVIRGGIGSELMTRKRKAREIREEDTGLSVKKKKKKNKCSSV